MALNHFASQIKQNQPEQLAENAVAASSLEEQTKKSSNLSQLENMKSKADALVQTTQVTSANQETIDATSVNTAINNEANVNPALKEIPLTWSDQQMLCALSAMQIRYGRSAEAIPYLMMIRKINPKNLECTRLLALAFMRLNRWREAEAMVEEFDHIQKANSGTPVNGLVLLYRSLVAFKTNRIADAKSWFGKFRSFNKVS